jgi:hypothetical protein
MVVLWRTLKNTREEGRRGRAAERNDRFREEVANLLEEKYLTVDTAEKLADNAKGGYDDDVERQVPPADPVGKVLTAVATTWPLEGHFAVGGAGLYVSTNCLGRIFTSRTTNYDLTVGLPQLDTVQQPGRVIPPAWTYDPRDDRERVNERDFIVWGAALGYGAKKAYPASAQDAAVVYHGRFYTTLSASNDDELLSASNDDEFFAAADDFLNELDDWWTRFTSWVGILASQDFVRLGSGMGGIKTRPLSMWTSNADGQRAGRDIRSYVPEHGIVPMSVLELHDLQACVTATGSEEPPPAEWLFIRDARSLLNGGQSRRAVIDAGTAAELALTTLIDRYLISANTDERVRKALTKRYTGLEGRTALVRRLLPGLLSDQLQRDLIDPRNLATHGGHSFTDAAAQTAVDLATVIVEEAQPLASLLSTQTS